MLGGNHYGDYYCCYAITNGSSSENPRIIGVSSSSSVTKN